MHRAALESREGYAVCVVDLDRFKKYNDRYGHAAGDVALRAVAAAIDGTLRSDDLIARYGGEEIVVLLANVDEESTVQGCERLRIAVGDLRLPHEALGPDAVITVSVGAAVFDPAAGELPASVFERADRALYQAKDGGRNRTVVAAPKSAIKSNRPRCPNSPTIRFTPARRPIIMPASSSGRKIIRKISTPGAWSST